MPEKKKDIILWKVVIKETRESIIVGRQSIDSDIQNLYNLTYKKGTVVRARRGSYGCFCFKTRGDAVDFSASEFGSIIIRVKAIGTIKPTPKKIPHIRWSNLKEFKTDLKLLKEGKFVDSPWPAPYNTVCCTAVEVLD